MRYSVEKSRVLEYVSRHGTLSALVVLICLAVYALNADPFAAQTVAPFDRLLEFPGWSSVQSNRQAVHLERSDILDSQLPAWITLKDQIGKGESPLWYPNGAGGQPISLELCNPTFLLFLAVKDNALAYYLVGLAKLVISGFGAYLLLKTFVRWLPSLWGGMVFMLCGFNAAWFFWDQVATAMWVPWLLWATVMYLKTEDLKWLSAITVTSLLMIFGGFFAVAGFGFYSFALLILVWNSYDFFGHWREAYKNADTRKSFLKKTALPLLAAGIAFLMSALTIVPFLDALSGTNLGYRTSGGMPLSIHDLLLFFTYEDPSEVERTAYIGVLPCMFALAGILPLFSGQNKHLRLFVFFNAVLVIITLSIAFGLLPHQLIEALPVFKNNPKWGRLLVVTLLGLAALSAVGLDISAAKLQALSSRSLRWTPLNAQRIIAVTLIAIIAIQFQSQKKLFNSFNAVVPSAWFYPMTPSIQYVKDHLKPLQSVIADDSYWFAGTLGAYGLPEWYAHSFRTDREKEVLGELVHDPFSSPTSMVVLASNIQFASPLMDKLVIKYLLVNKKAWLEPIGVLTLQDISHSPAPPLPDNSWTQHISLLDDMEIGAIGFLFATHRADHAPADVRLTVYRDNHEISSAKLDKNKIVDNEWAFFEFPHKVFLKKGGYSLALSLAGYNGPGKLTAWATKVRENSGAYLEINGMKSDSALKMRIDVYMKMDRASIEKKWKVVDREKDIVILENKQVTNSAYFVNKLDPSDDHMDFSGLNVEQASVDLITINYLKKDAGWIVLPMHLHSGWKASVDGRQVAYEAYLGMLPAIPVRGASQVIFRYEPRSFKTGAVLSATGAVIFALFSLVCVRYGMRRNPS